MAQILNGKEVNKKIIKDLQVRSIALGKKGVIPILAIVRIGRNPDDLAYERSIEKIATESRIYIRQFAFEDTITTEEMAAEIEELNRNKMISGMLIFRPLPKHIDERKICNLIPAAKDVDGVTDGSAAYVYTGEGEGFVPCTAEACIEMLKYYKIPLEGKNAVVIGRSQVIGKPVSMLLLKENATVTICHSKTKDLEKICSDKDIIIAAAGCAGIVSEGCFNENQTVLDVAINFDSEGNMCGDVDFEAAKEKVYAVTPVPGGIGSVTTAILMRHIVEAAEKSCK